MKILTNYMDKLATHERYDFPLSPRDRAWEFHVLGVGRRRIGPNTRYQVHEKQSPVQWNHGRTLRDFGLVYLTRGNGTFRSRTATETSVSAGDMMVLFPGVWHNYSPSRQSGWDEFWILFNGRHAARIMKHYFKPEKSVLQPGLDAELLRIFSRMLTVAQQDPSHGNPILASLNEQILAMTLNLCQTQTSRDRGNETAMESAKRYFNQHFHESVDMNAVACSLDLSYRNFRRRFKASTGLAPRQYLLNLRINHAKRLLEEQQIKLAEVAARTGFKDSFYFSRLFKAKTGIWPSQWRL